MSDLRVGVVGVGWGSLVHAPAFQAAQGFDLVALCSRRPEPLEAAGAKHGITDLSTDWASFVRRDDLDLIAVASPVDLHRDITVAAVTAGKHVLCEKPAALTAADAKEMLDAAQAAGVMHTTCFETRWLPERLTVWDQVRAGMVGKPYSLRIVHSADYWHPTHAPQSEWMYRRDAGGGYLMGMLSHDIDFACALVGEPVAVTAHLGTSVKRRAMQDGHEIDVDADDTTTLILRFANGAAAVISCSVVGAHSRGTRFDMFGENGTLLFENAPARKVTGGRASDPDLAEIPLTEREPKKGAITSKARSAAMVRAQALMLEDWLANRDNPDAAVPTLRAGWRVQQIIEAARSSAAGAGWVELQ